MRRSGVLGVSCSIGFSARPPASPRRSLRSRLILFVLIGGLPACGGSTTPPPERSGRAEPHTKSGRLVTMVTPSRLLPDVVGDRGVVAAEHGQRRLLVDGMRVVARDDGTLVRARELFPRARVEPSPVPTRFGGGWLFSAQTGGSTQIWRAAGWLERLEPVVQIGVRASDVIAGFDRLYVRLESNGALRAFDVATGEPRPLGLPPAGAYGPVTFADGWRAIVDADLRGPLVTFDAGQSWRPLAVQGRTLAAHSASGHPTIVSTAGEYTVEPSGAVTFRAAGGEQGEDAPDPVGPPPGPFGKRPLRAAIESGWPDSPTTAVVARGGALARVALRDGAVLATSLEAYRETQARCQAIRLGPETGPGFGFFCGERDGATIVYAFEPPLAVREVVRFSRPRFVSASGNGALVVRGSCDDATMVAGDTRAYCIRSASGSTREVRVRAQGGELGVERVVALRDGRVAVLAPPRPGTSGQITVLEGDVPRTRALVLPEGPKDVVRDLAGGMWLEGFEEHRAGELSGWVEAGGGVVGIRVALDGKVTAGQRREAPDGNAILSGRFAFVLAGAGRAGESTDFGFSWKDLDVPERERDAGSARTRACGPAGCALQGWIRVGWGDTAVRDDLDVAVAPPSAHIPLRPPTTLALACELVGSVARGNAPREQTRPPRFVGPRVPKPEPRTPWTPFLGGAPPALGKDEVGFDAGSSSSDSAQMRAFVWGKKGADWGRVGSWQVRFDDRFDPAGGLRSSAPTTSPWLDENAASQAMTHYISWTAIPDPSGTAALIAGCQGQTCVLHAVVDGQPSAHLRDTGPLRGGLFPKPLPFGAVRASDSWWFLTNAPTGPSDGISLWRTDGGVARIAATFPRARSSAGHPISDPPRLVRRAQGGGVGLLFSSIEDPADRHGTMFVVPIDPDTAAAGEPVRLGPRDLQGVVPPRCAPRDDGWAIDLLLESAPDVSLGTTRPALGSVEMRLRMEPAHTCVDAVSATIDGTYDDKDKRSKPAGDGWIRLAATEKPTQRRLSFVCQPKGSSAAPSKPVGAR